MLRWLRWAFQSPCIPRVRDIGSHWLGEWGPCRTNASTRWCAWMSAVWFRLFGEQSIPDWMRYGFRVVVVRCPDCERRRARVEVS